MSRRLASRSGPVGTTTLDEPANCSCSASRTRLARSALRRCLSIQAVGWGLPTLLFAALSVDEEWGCWLRGARDEAAAEAAAEER